MSILNLALQGVGIARAKTTLEDQLQKCKNMKQIRELAQSVDCLEEAVLDSLERPKSLLSGLFGRLKLKEEPFSVFSAATQKDILSLWESVKQIDSSLERTDTTRVLTNDKKELQEFIQTHCKVRHYMFSVKKCTDSSCGICQPPRLPADIFSIIHHLPDPVPEGDKYRSFEKMYGSQTSVKHRPSLTSAGAKTHGMPFPPSAQYARNVKVVLQCGECFKWRVLYSKHSLKKDQREELEFLIEDLDYYLWKYYR